MQSCTTIPVVMLILQLIVNSSMKESSRKEFIPLSSSKFNLSTITRYWEYLRQINHDFSESPRDLDDIKKSLNDK
jgi:hypothetical protein